MARRYFDEFHNKREAEAMPKYVDVIRGDATIRSAEELNSRHFFESALYHEIWRPQRLHYRLEAIVRGPERKPLGSLVLYREQGDRIFGRADEQTLEALVSYVAHGLLRARDRPVDYAHGDCRSVLVNLDGLGRIVHLSRDAFKVLLLAHGDVSPASAAQEPASQSFPTLAPKSEAFMHAGGRLAAAQYRRSGDAAAQRIGQMGAAAGRLLDHRSHGMPRPRPSRGRHRTCPTAGRGEGRFGAAAALRQMRLYPCGRRAPAYAGE